MLRFLADGSLILLLSVSAIAGLVWLVRERPKWQTWLPYVLMAGLTSLTVGKLMSFWQPSTIRPFIEKGVEAGAAYIDNPGFPSDHMLLAVIVVATVYCLTTYKKLSYLLAILVLAMAVARVAALVHTPLDMLGGLVAGLAGSWWYIKRKRDISTS
ncbi:phosphatase PAP2 family protein [Candidatus Saccharibacteria bacterium]|nr:phosphatase PAP2 family protein [Candidatus Saccharibacteria bacterium]NCU40237.1 phosphatase PAP2 family protein [Candidatus Saccharibacteria bacterium]